MTFERIVWSLTVFAGLLGALLFLLAGFRGYALLVLLLAIAASVNLLGHPGREHEAPVRADDEV